MNIKVKFFGPLREKCGTECEIMEAVTNTEALKLHLQNLYQEVNWKGVVVAVNKHYAGPQTQITPDDEIAIIPPVSGG